MLAANPGTLHNKGRHPGAGSAGRLPRPGPPPRRAGAGPVGEEALPRPRPAARGRPPARACRAPGAGGGGEPARLRGQGRAGEGRGGGRRSAGRPGSGRDKGAQVWGLPAPPPGRRDPARPTFPPAAMTGPGSPPPAEPLAAGSSLQAGPHLPVGGERASDPGPGSNALCRRRQPPPPRAAPPPPPRANTDGTLWAAAAARECAPQRPPRLPPGRRRRRRFARPRARRALPLNTTHCGGRHEEARPRAPAARRGRGFHKRAGAEALARPAATFAGRGAGFRGWRLAAGFCGHSCCD
ncbi:translation initiation factor IF-2-like [Budorcas taxicolor]|uniref:translation initiation factor IF-2-like n=1 Tax=Budorcas taxicolor TaxID=37181 RepID=UPI0022833E24|nr:translation initiation factor IF-2-like [Budorcas taxicolor]